MTAVVAGVRLTRRNTVLLLLAYCLLVAVFYQCLRREVATLGREIGIVQAAGDDVDAVALPLLPVADDRLAIMATSNTDAVDLGTDDPIGIDDDDIDDEQISTAPLTIPRCTSDNPLTTATTWPPSNVPATAVTAFHWQDVHLFRRVLAEASGQAQDYCIDTIQSPLSAPSKYHIHATSQPLRSTYAALLPGDYARGVVLVRDPIYAILAEFEREYQTELDEAVMSTPLFQQFARSKAFLWRWHLQHWIAQEPRHERFTYIKVEDLAVDTEQSLEALAAFFGVDSADQSACLSPGLATTLDELWRDIVRIEELKRLLPTTVRASIIDETEPYFCMFGYDQEYEEEASHLPGCTTYAFEDVDHQHLLNGDHWWKQDDLPNRRRDYREIHIITTYFHSDNADRQRELDDAFQHTFANPAISRMHVWIDDESNLLQRDDHIMPPVSSRDDDRLRIVRTHHQPHYADLFEYANTHLQDQIVVIQNADISWPRESVVKLRALHKGMVFALSRHSHHPEFTDADCAASTGHNRNLCQHYAGSHDTFVFIPPIDPAVLRQLTFKQNTWGAENVVIEALKFAGYAVENPCEEVITVHRHCSGVRRNTGMKVRATRLLGASVPARQERLAYRVYPRSLADICANGFCNEIVAQ